MASSNTNKMKRDVILTEDDIPGAKIPRESLEHCSVSQLKRWLLCRGVKVTSRKAVLIARIKDYQQNGIDSKYLRDPDGGIHLLKKKAELGLLESKKPANKSFPKEGFNCDISGIPKLSFGTIWRFMIDNVESKKQLSTAKPLEKGYNFYKSGNVLFISHLSQDGKHYIKSKVLPSMKKNAVYTYCIVLSAIGNVLRAHCGCPAGIDGRCNHIAATLFSLEEFCKLREKQNTESCTSKPCKWNVPRKRTGQVEPIARMTFSKHDSTKKKRMSVLPADLDVRAESQRTWPEAKLKSMFDLVSSYQERSGNKVGWLHVLPQELRIMNNNGYESVGKVMAKYTSDECDLLSPLKQHLPSLTTIKDRCEQVKRKLQLNEGEILEAEKSTEGQSKNSTWYALRKYRITASQCHRVASLRNSTSPTKAIQEVLMMKSTYQSNSMEEGIIMEDQIITEYVLHMQKKGHTDIAVNKCGFFVSKENGILGASPDGLVEDPSVAQAQGLMEVKYVQTQEGESLNDALIRKRICIEQENPVLNTKHKYYYQVQQQMYVTNRHWTDFVVKGSQSTGIFCQRIRFSREFWRETLAKLQAFYDTWIAPELAYPRVKYGLSKYDYRSE